MDSILIITTMPGASGIVSNLEEQLECTVDLASGLETALSTMRRRDYAVVVTDESLAERDSRAADLIWKHAGLAVPMQVNFAITGSSRLVRDVRAAMGRREQEQAIAARAAKSSIESDLRVTVTGLLLHCQLALSEPSVPPQISEKLQTVVQLAGNLRERLQVGLESAHVGPRAV